MANINDFKTQLSSGGARANQFEVTIRFPTLVGAAGVSQQLKFLCKSASLPASSIQNIAVPFRGKEVNFAGERSYEPWQISVLNETNFAIRNSFERWIDIINPPSMVGGLTSPSLYQVQMQVTQLDRNGFPLMHYTFVDAYPINIGDIALSFDNGQAIEEFPVTFQYNYWTGTNPETGAGSLLAGVGKISNAISAVAGLL
jgi:hypothetical protein